MKNAFRYMRGCVKKAFEEGSDRGYEFRRMRHAIIVELRRLGFESSEIKDKLLEWNKRCEKVLNQKEARRQLLQYVDWAFKQRKCVTGCKALQEYCIGKDKCTFYKINSFRKKLLTETLPFDMQKLEKYLQERFRADSRSMMMVVRALRLYQIQKETGETMLIGYRKICSLVQDNYRCTPYPMDIYRKMQMLIDEGVIEQTEKGKNGTFTGKANGYRFLPWQPPTRKA